MMALRIGRIIGDKGRSRISMIWVPLLEFDPYCGGKLRPIQNKFTLSTNLKKIVYKRYDQILNNQLI